MDQWTYKSQKRAATRERKRLREQGLLQDHEWTPGSEHGVASAKVAATVAEVPAKVAASVAVVIVPGLLPAGVPASVPLPPGLLVPPLGLHLVPRPPLTPPPPSLLQPAPPAVPMASAVSSSAMPDIPAPRTPEVPSPHTPPTLLSNPVAPWRIRAKARPRSASLPTTTGEQQSSSDLAASTSPSATRTKPWMVPEIEIFTWGEKNLDCAAPAVDGVWDVRRLYDPRHSLCCGHNGTLQFNVAMHASAPELFKHIHGTLDSLSLSDRRPIKLGLYCNRGRHRSVAVAELLAFILRSMALRVAVHHLTLGKWACGCPGPECWTLQERDPHVALNERLRDRDVARAVVDRLWHRS